MGKHTISQRELLVSHLRDGESIDCDPMITTEGDHAMATIEGVARRDVMPPSALELVKPEFRSAFIRDFYVHYRDHEICVEDQTEWRRHLAAAILESAVVINAIYANPAQKHELWSRFDDLWMGVL